MRDGVLARDCADHLRGPCLAPEVGLTAELSPGPPMWPLVSHSGCYSPRLAPCLNPHKTSPGTAVEYQRQASQQKVVQSPLGPPLATISGTRPPLARGPSALGSTCPPVLHGPHHALTQRPCPASGPWESQAEAPGSHVPEKGEWAVLPYAMCVCVCVCVRLCVTCSTPHSPRRCTCLVHRPLRSGQNNPPPPLGGGGWMGRRPLQKIVYLTSASMFILCQRQICLMWAGRWVGRGRPGPQTALWSLSTGLRVQGPLAWRACGAGLLHRPVPVAPHSGPGGSRGYVAAFRPPLIGLGVTRGPQPQIKREPGHPPFSRRVHACHPPSSRPPKGEGGIRSAGGKVATRRNMRREERVTVQGPVKEQQPDGMSHRGGGGVMALCRDTGAVLCRAETAFCASWNAVELPLPFAQSVHRTYATRSMRSFGGHRTR